MRYRNLGRTGIKVSPYALGTLMFASQMGNDPDESVRIIRKAIDAGINLIDTADRYADSEDIVGKALKGRRDDVVLATKVGMPMGEGANQRGASRRWITTSVENSLRRLGTDYIDIYQLHRPDPDTDLEEILAVLTDLVRLDDGPGPVGRRTCRTAAVPHRAAAVLDPEPRHRTGGPADRAGVRHGRHGVGPVRPGPADRPGAQGR
jgi:hypothetical protein